MQRLFCKFSWKVRTQKINNICEIQETKCPVCSWIFVVSTRMSYVPHAMFMEFWLELILGAIFVENSLFSKLKQKLQTLFALLENYLKEWLTFAELKKQNVFCAYDFPGSPRKSLFFGLSPFLQNDENVHTAILHWQ